MIVYNALVKLAVAAAVDPHVDPDMVSFTTVLALTRASIVPETPCPGCGYRSSQISDPATVVIAAITTQPLNRTGRRRTGPRTKQQRLTGRTRDVTYSIDITPPNLPREDETA